MHVPETSCRYALVISNRPKARQPVQEAKWDPALENTSRSSIFPRLRNAKLAAYRLVIIFNMTWAGFSVVLLAWSIQAALIVLGASAQDLVSANGIAGSNAPLCTSALSPYVCERLLTKGGLVGLFFTNGFVRDAVANRGKGVLTRASNWRLLQSGARIATKDVEELLHWCCNQACESIGRKGMEPIQPATAPAPAWASEEERAKWRNSGDHALDGRHQPVTPYLATVASVGQHELRA